jgi:hypothetical protein
VSLSFLEVPLWDDENIVDGGMVIVMMIWFGRGEGNRQQVQGFLWVLKLVSLVCSLVG